MIKDRQKCKFCNRRTDVKFGWEQPPLENVIGNVVNELEVKVVVHDYKTTTPQIIITSKKFFTNGIATIYIPIHYCPICGRRLGEDGQDA